jgi:hypothetical protein
MVPPFALLNIIATEVSFRQVIDEMAEGRAGATVRNRPAIPVDVDLVNVVTSRGFW